MDSWYKQDNDAYAQKLKHNNDLMRKTLRKYNHQVMISNQLQAMNRTLNEEVEAQLQMLHEIFEENVAYRQRFATQLQFEDLPVQGPILQADETLPEEETEEELWFSDDDIQHQAEELEELRQEERRQQLDFD